MTPVTADELASTVADHGVEVVGRLLDASNVAFFATTGDTPVIYKPIRGERPLWDFPTGCLAHRERASFLLDQAAGFGVVPPTVLHDGPLGPGSVQFWVTDPDALLAGEENDPSDDLVELGDLDDSDAGDDSDTGDDGDGQTARTLFVLAPPAELRPPWLPVFTGELSDGREVVLAHADSAELRSVAVLDAVLNNSDRKGSHLLRSPQGHLWGIDQGLCLHEQPKLRTVLWGWAGEPLPPADRDRIHRLAEALRGEELIDELGDLLTTQELGALTRRVDRLVETGRHPTPQPGWPSVPWPAL